MKKFKNMKELMSYFHEQPYYPAMLMKEILFAMLWIEVKDMTENGENQESAYLVLLNEDEPPIKSIDETVEIIKTRNSTWRKSIAQTDEGEIVSFQRLK